jgi:hypothetical protein
MSTQASRSFQILSASVCTDADVFDHLVEVKDLATGEEGLLLCSHYCRWPEELIAEATWLEGCYTPPQWARDTRLALGAHPNSITSWEVNKASKVITLSASLKQVVEGDYDEDEVYYLPFQWRGYEENSFVGCRRLRAAWRLFRNQFNGEELLPVEVLQRFAEAIQLGRIDVRRHLVHHLYLVGDPGVITILEEENLDWGQDEDMDWNHIEYRNDGSCKVIQQDPANGFLEAVELPYFLVEEQSSTPVVNDWQEEILDNWGILDDWDPECQEEEDVLTSLTVVGYYPDEGWAPAVSLAYGIKSKENGCTFLEVTRLGGGWAPAIPIKYIKDGLWPNRRYYKGLLVCFDEPIMRVGFDNPALGYMQAVSISV